MEMTPRSSEVRREAMANAVTDATPMTPAITRLSIPHMRTPETDTTKKWKPGGSMRRASPGENSRHEKCSRENLRVSAAKNAAPAASCRNAYTAATPAIPHPAHSASAVSRRLTAASAASPYCSRSTRSNARNPRRNNCKGWLKTKPARAMRSAGTMAAPGPDGVFRKPWTIPRHSPKANGREAEEDEAGAQNTVDRVPVVARTGFSQHVLAYRGETKARERQGHKHTEDGEPEPVLLLPKKVEIKRDRHQRAARRHNKTDVGGADA